MGPPRFCFNCFMAKRSFLNSNREAATNFLKAIIEGLVLLKKDKPLGVRLIKKYLRLSDEAAAIGYDFYIVKHGDGLLVCRNDRVGVRHRRSRQDQSRRKQSHAAELTFGRTKFLG